MDFGQSHQRIGVRLMVFLRTTEAMAIPFTWVVGYGGTNIDLGHHAMVWLSL